MHNSIFKYWKYTTALLLALGLGGCEKQEPTTQKQPPLPVQVLKAELQTLPITFEANGQTDGYVKIEVRPRISGILKTKGYIEGQFVKAGTLLYSLDAKVFIAQLNSAKANKKAQQALVVQSAENFKRIKTLFEQNAISQREYEAALATRDSAAANYQVAVAQTEAAQENVDYTQIRAPLSGITSLQVLSLGNLVNPENILTTITQIDPIYVNYSFSDNEWYNLQRDIANGSILFPKTDQITVRLQLPDGNLYPIEGRINFRDVNVSPTTGTIHGRAIFNNPKGTLLPGLFVRVLFDGVQRNNAVLIPQRAVTVGLQDQSVWVVTADNTVQKRVIQTAETLSTNTIVTSGLKEGDLVVLDNISKLGMMPTGSKVKPDPVSLEQFTSRPLVGNVGAAQAAPAKSAE